MRDVELGLGLVSIGRQWGYRWAGVPSEGQVNALLAAALQCGVRFFDTAPSYGSTSEARLGAFLRTLGREQLAEIAVATKFGEHWDDAADRPYLDQGYDALCRSVDRSLERLPRLDLLQLHKSTPEALRDAGVRRAFEYARSCGVRWFGASVKDLESTRIAAADELFTYVQFPYNLARASLEAVFEIADDKRLLINRPLGEGRLLYDEHGAPRGDGAIEDAFRFVLAKPFHGVVLTGTSSVAHLEQNVRAFRAVRA